MRMFKTVLGATALTAALAVPSAASAAEAILPPGNSAATQYTESFPTSGGNAVLNNNLGKGGGNNTRPPKQVLGAETTEALEAHGSEGETIAALAAEAAPPAANPGKKAHHDSGDGKAENPGQTSGNGGNGPSTGSSGPGLSETASGGESAFGQVLSQATASSSGTMGFFLPVAIGLALFWAVAYVWRRHSPGQATS